MMRKFLILPLLAALVPGPAMAGQSDGPVPHAESIQSPSLSFMPAHAMVDRLMDEDPGVQRARALMKSAEADARARDAGPHEFTLHGEYVSRASNIDGRMDEWMAGISRGIRLPGKAEADGKIGALGVVVAENSLGDSRHQAATMLKNLWLAWVTAEADAELAVAQVADHEKELQAMERSRQLGQAAMLQVEQVQASLATARAQAARAAQARLDARMTLGRNFPALALPAQPPAIPDPAPPPGLWQEWRDAVLNDNHEVKMARSEADRREWLARRASLDRFADPTVDLRTFQDRAGHETGFGIGFIMPIGGSLRSAVADQASAEASAAAVAARKVLRDVEVAADRDVIQAQQGLNAWEQSQAATKASAQLMVRMRRAYALGDLGLTELLLAERQDFETRQSELQARSTAHGAILQLMIDAHRIWSLGDE